MEKQLFRTWVVCADLANRTLRIRKESLAKMYDLSSPETQLILQYRHCYPDFKNIAV